MANNLSVKVTADVSELQAKFAVARAEVSGLTAEMNRLARASAAGIIDPSGQARLAQVSSDFVKAKTSAAALGAELSHASGGVLGFAQNMEHAHGSLSTATREFRALFDELSSGRTRQTPGTLAIIAQRVLGLGPATLGAVAGVALLAGGLGYLVYRALEASKALAKIDLSAAFAGNLDITRTSIERYSQELAHASNVSTSESRKIVASFAAVPGMTNAALGALSETIPAFARMTGEASDKAAEGLAKLFSAEISAGEFTKKIGLLTQLSQQQLNEARTADLSGDANKIMGEKLTLLNQVLLAATPALKNFSASAESSFKNTFAFTSLIASGYTTLEAEAELYGGEAAAIDKAAAARARYIAIMKAAPPSDTQVLKTGVAAAAAQNPVSQQIEEAKSKIAEMTAALQVAQTAGDQIDLAKLNAGLEKAREELSSLQFGPVLERMREQMEQVAATWDGTQSGMLSKQIQIAQATLANVSGNAKQEVQVETEIARLKLQVRQQSGSEAIAIAREQVSALGSAERLGTVERLAAERDIWSQLVAGDRLTANQRIEVQRDLNRSIVEITRERASEAQAISRQDIATDISIARLRIEAAKEAASSIEAATQAQALQRLTTLRNLTQQEFALNESSLEGELARVKDQPVVYDQVYNQIRELKAKLVVDLGRLDEQYAASVKRSVKEESLAWKGAVGEIETAEGSLVSDLLNRRKSLAQSLISVSADLVTREIANDVKAMTTRLLLANSEQNAQKAMEQGGFLFHLLFQNQKTASTVTSQSAQTSATISGDAARASATASAAAAAKAQQAAIGPSQVIADAAMAYAGTYASVSAIPVVGWAMAPAAAEAAFAAVSAYAGLAAFDVGAWNIPHDMVAKVHKGETVVPQTFAEGAREAGGFGGGENHFHLQVSAIDAASVSSLIHSQGFRDEFAAMASRYVNRGGRG